MGRLCAGHGSGGHIRRGGVRDRPDGAMPRASRRFHVRPAGRRLRRSVPAGQCGCSRADRETRAVHQVTVSLSEPRHSGTGRTRIAHDRAARPPQPGTKEPQTKQSEQVDLKRPHPGLPQTPPSPRPPPTAGREATVAPPVAPPTRRAPRSAAPVGGSSSGRGKGDGFSMTSDRVFVAGAGFMGHGIAQVHAAAGKQVTLYEPDLARAEAAARRGSPTTSDALGRQGPPHRGRPRRASRAISADRIDRAPSPLPTSSSRPSSRTSTSRPRSGRRSTRARPRGDLRHEHVVDLDRRGSPRPSPRRVATVRRDALLQPGPGDAADRADPRRRTRRTRRRPRFATSAAELDKQVIVSADRPGFIVNRILMPLLAEAMRAYEEGLGTAEDIDTGARVGLNHPMGPLELADFIGLDVCLGVMSGAARGHRRRAVPAAGDPRALVADGQSRPEDGRGFYTYPREPRVPRATAPASLHSVAVPRSATPTIDTVRPSRRRMASPAGGRRVRRRSRATPGSARRRS